jgi:hypothetical protein
VPPAYLSKRRASQPFAILEQNLVNIGLIILYFIIINKQKPALIINFRKRRAPRGWPSIPF